MYIIYIYIHTHKIGIIRGMENTLHQSKNDQITVIKSHSPLPPLPPPATIKFYSLPINVLPPPFITCIVTYIKGAL